jgi:glycerol-3-phosphate acyltransferase PlsY
MSAFPDFTYLYVPLAYLLGSIPFGLLLSFATGYGDIRKIGSGNIGATNVLRTGNKKLAVLTLALDILKGAIPVWLSFHSNDMLIIFASVLATILGHMYPVWLRFKGGKGVATSLGALTALLPPLGMAMIGIWLLTAFFFRMSSLAALTAFAAAPVLSALCFGDENAAMLAGLIAALVFWKHRENIRRLLKGEEPKIRFKKDE